MNMSDDYPKWRPPAGSQAMTEPVGTVQTGHEELVVAKTVRADAVATEIDGARTTRFILKCFESARTGEIIKF